MEFGEGKNFDGSSFRFLEDSNIEKKKEEGKRKVNGFKESLSLDVVENKQETDFEIEITGEDIEGIEYQIEQEKKKEDEGEMEDSHRIELEAALGKISKEAPELGIKEKELTDDDIKKYNEKRDTDIKKAVEKKTEEGARKGWDKETLDKETESVKIGIEGEQASHLKDIFGDKRLREKGLELSDEKWERMVKGLEYSIKKRDWDEVITRAGQMNNINSEKFDELKKSDRNPFDANIKKEILQEVNLAREGKMERVREEKAGKFAKDIEQVSKCFPEDIGKEIEISPKDWKVLMRYLAKVRSQDWGKKELTDFGKKSEYWKVAQTAACMKEIKRMIENGEIKTVKD